MSIKPIVTIQELKEALDTKNLQIRCIGATWEIVTDHLTGTGTTFDDAVRATLVADHNRQQRAQ